MRLRFLLPVAPLLPTLAFAGDLPFVPLAARALSGQDPVFAGGISAGERFGRAVTGIGDLDGDGIPDIAVGSRSDADGGTDAGAVYIVFLDRDLSPRAARKIGAKSGDLPPDSIGPGDMFGYGVAGLGDLDGDGIPDLAITAPGGEPEGSGPQANSGVLFVCFLRADGSVREAKRHDASNGLPVSVGDSAGQACASLGDLDGDGVPEVGIGAPGADDGGFNRGAVLVVRLDRGGGRLGTDRLSESTAPRHLAFDDVDQFGGRGIATLGDLDGDGCPEVAVGCYRDDDGGPDRGSVWILSLAPRAGGISVEAARKISSTVGTLPGPIADGDLFGMTVAPLGDLDGDGVPDLAVGNNKSDLFGRDTGALLLLGLAPDGSVRTQATVGSAGSFPGLALLGGERFGRALAEIGDTHGDGRRTLAVGAGAGVAGGRLWLLSIGPVRSPDLDGNGLVDGGDLAGLLGDWGRPGRADLDWSGSIDAVDLARLMAAWGG